MKNKKEKNTILVLEDEPSLLAAITAKLEKSGFGVLNARSVEQAFNAKLEEKVLKNKSSVMSARTLVQALKYLEELEQIDAIWLDHTLLGSEDGLDFVKKFKANGGRWTTIPVFVVSNNENDKTVQEYLAAGVSKYYIKSNHPLAEIIEDIQKFLG